MEKKRCIIESLHIKAADICVILSKPSRIQLQALKNTVGQIPSMSFSISVCIRHKAMSSALTRDLSSRDLFKIRVLLSPCLIHNFEFVVYERSAQEFGQNSGLAALEYA